MQERALSRRHLEVLKLIAEGLTHRTIAARLKKSVRTIESIARELHEDTGCKNSVQLTRYAIARGLVPTTWEGARDEAEG